MFCYLSGDAILAQGFVFVREAEDAKRIEAHEFQRHPFSRRTGRDADDGPFARAGSGRASREPCGGNIRDGRAGLDHSRLRGRRNGGECGDSDGLATNAAEKRAAARKQGGYWLDALEDAVMSRTYSWARGLIAAYEASQVAFVAERAIGVAIRGERWTPVDHDKDVEVLLLAAAR